MTARVIEGVLIKSWALKNLSIYSKSVGGALIRLGKRARSMKAYILSSQMVVSVSFIGT